MFAILVLVSLMSLSFSEARIDPCRMPLEPGLCLGYFPSYGYDAESGECVEFVYGGCGGNLNRFASKERCERACRR